MKQTRIITIWILCLLLLTGMGTSCAKQETGGSVNDVTVPEAQTDLPLPSAEAPDLTDSTAITLSDSGTTVTGGGATEKDGVVTVTDGGVYTFTGSLSDGRILVNAPNGEVTLVLDGVSVACSYGSPLYIYQSSQTTVWLEDGSQNTLQDGASYTFADSFSSSAEDEPNACLYSKSDLIIAGNGRLTVDASHNNGITSKDTLQIESATVTVNAKNHGINGKDSCAVQDAVLNVTSGGDALRSTNDTDSQLGWILINNSDLTLTAGEDGIQAETSLTVSSGSFSIVSGGGSNAVIPEDGGKGLKGGTDVLLSGGTYVLDCCDDAIHANGSVTVSGGTYRIRTGDDGIHADGSTVIGGGTVTIEKSYEGIEGETVAITGGTITVTAGDDGINAAGGADQSGFGGGRDSFLGSSDCSITISGGVTTVNASGDGVDSNGSLTVSGGELYVSGPTDNGNSALDFDGTSQITGGLVVAAGASGMAQNFGSGSTQGSILLSFSSSSGDTVTLTDSDGKTLLEFTPEKSYNCVLISCPSIQQGSTYTVSACGQNQTVTMDSLQYGTSGGMGGGMGGGRPGGKGLPPGMF